MEPRPAPSLDALPRDLLLHIASFVPAHPRLLLLGTLNRRWRSIVLGSLPFPPFPTHSYIYYYKFERIIHLASADVRTFHHPNTSPCPCAHLTQLTSLTSLSVNLSSGSCTLEVLRRNASSLTSLSLDVRPTLWRLTRRVSLTETPAKSTLTALRTMHFPRLTDLSCFAEFDSGELADLVRAHASQLTSLRITGFGVAEMVPRLPACRHLSLHHLPLSTLPEFAAAIAGTGASLDLALPVDKAPQFLRLFPAHTVRAVTIANTPHEPGHPLMRCTDLRTLHIRELDGATPPPGLIHLAMHCTDLAIGGFHALRADALLVHSRLTRLSLADYASLLRATHRCPLPSLAHLTLTGRQPLAYIVKQFPIDRMPRLRTLSFRAHRTSGHGRLYTDFLRDLEQRGVTEVDMVCSLKENRRRDGATFRWLRATASPES